MIDTGKLAPLPSLSLPASYIKENMLSVRHTQKAVQKSSRLAREQATSDT